MTDEQIIKALECCGEHNTFCNECSYKHKTVEYCGSDLFKDAVALINRQKAEIEKLKEDVSFNIKLNALLAEQRDGRDKLIEALDEQCDTLNVKLKTAKFEAIKEFWDKLKTEARLRNHTNYGKNELATAHNEGVIIARKHTLVCGDNLVKEMTEQKE